MSTIVIAEAGVNHNGDLKLAKKMVEQAKEAGADYIKFQTFCSEDLVVRKAEKADYQILSTSKEETQLTMLKKLELPFEAFIELEKYCQKCEIGFLSTPFDMTSISFLNALKMDYWKIPSGEITDYPYLKQIAMTGKPIILSTGMSAIEEIQSALDILYENNCSEITLLHCNSEYPTPYQDVNLYAIENMREKFKIPIGYSDHTIGITVPIAAVALGASIIEKHFTLDRDMEGPDQKASLTVKELKCMVTAIRNVEKAMGDGVKKVTASEKKNITIVRKSIVARKKIHKGERYTDDNITVKRPGNGISPMEWNNILGTKANKDYEIDEQIIR